MNKFWSALGGLRPRQLVNRPWQKLLSLSLSVWCMGTAVMVPVSAQRVAPTARGFVINGSQSGDNSGNSVSDAGDVNGDGLPDQIIGAKNASPNGRIHAGRSYVVFGKRNKKPVDLLAIESGASQDGFVINGSHGASGSFFGDFSGYSVSGAGDVNGDGLADVIVGAPGALFGGSAGRSYVVFGKSNNQPVNLSALESGTSPDGFVINGSQSGSGGYTGDNSGYSVSRAGDVNGDGLADVLVGAPIASPGQYEAGRSYVVFGKNNSQPVNLVDIESGTSQDGFVINGSYRYFSGWSVSDAGDVNGDGLADLIVGAIGADPAGRTDAGRSYVVFGKINNQPVELSTLESGTSQGGFVINGSTASDQSGFSVSGARDVNGDGLADVIVGAISADPAGRTNAGRSYVVFGKKNSLPVELSALESGTSSDGFVINGSNINDYSGLSVSGAGDVNGDGLADLIVGAYGADPAGATNAGRSYVVFGKINNQPVELLTLESGTSQDGFVINGSTAGDKSGRSVSGAGDVNGDGLADVLVGAPIANGTAGRSYVVAGKRNGQPVNLVNFPT